MASFLDELNALPDVPATPSFADQLNAIQPATEQQPVAQPTGDQQPFLQLLDHAADASDPTRPESARAVSAALATPKESLTASAGKGFVVGANDMAAGIANQGAQAAAMGLPVFGPIPASVFPQPMREAAGKVLGSAADWFRQNNIGEPDNKFAGGVGKAGAYMAAGLAGGAALGAGSAAPLGTALVAAPAAAESIDAAKKAGMNDTQAAAAGAISGAWNAAVGQLVNKIPVVGKWMQERGSGILDMATRQLAHTEATFSLMDLGNRIEQSMIQDGITPEAAKAGVQAWKENLPTTLAEGAGFAAGALPSRMAQSKAMTPAERTKALTDAGVAPADQQAISKLKLSDEQFNAALKTLGTRKTVDAATVEPAKTAEPVPKEVAADIYATPPAENLAERKLTLDRASAEAARLPKETEPTTTLPSGDTVERVYGPQTDTHRYYHTDAVTGQRSEFSPAEHPDLAAHTDNAVGTGITKRSGQALADIVAPGKKVTVVGSIDEVPPDVRAGMSPQVSERGTSGLYNSKDGRSFVILDQVKGIGDFFDTISHEAVGHGGVRAVLGERFNSFLDGVHALIPEAARKGIETAYGTEKRTVSDEYLAHLAENPQSDLSTWRKAVGWVRNEMRERFGLAVNDADVRYILDRARRERGTVMGDGGVVERKGKVSTSNEPIKVYRGAESADLHAGPFMDMGGISAIGPSFSESREVAASYNPKVTERTITPQNPKRFRSYNALRLAIFDFAQKHGLPYGLQERKQLAEIYANELRQQGYDAIVFPEGMKTDVKKNVSNTWIVLDRATARDISRRRPLPQEAKDALREMGMHERKTITRAANDERFAPEADALRAEGKSLAPNFEMGDTIELAKQSYVADPMKAMADLASEKDEMVKTARGVGIVKAAMEAKQDLSVVAENLKQALGSVAELGTLGGTILRTVRELKIGTPEGRAQLNTALFDKFAESKNFKVTPELRSELTRMFDKAERITDPKKQAEAVQDAVVYATSKMPLRLVDLWDAYRYSNALSGPRAHERNIFGNLVSAAILRPASLVGQGDIKGVMPYLRGAVNAVNDAWSNAANVMRNNGGEIAKEIGAIEKGDFQKAYSKKLPRALKFIPNLLEAQDQFFSTLIKAGEMNRLTRNGMDAKIAAKEAEQLANRYLYREKLGVDSKDRSLNAFNRALDAIGSGLDDLRNKPALGPLIKPVLLFVRTPFNVAKLMVDVSPAGFAAVNMRGGKLRYGLTKNEIANSKFGKDFNNLKDAQKGVVESEFRERVGLAVAGTMAMTVGAIAAATGQTTWAAPEDEKLRTQFYASGKKPFSWNGIPMATFGPFALALAFPAAIRDAMADNPKMHGKDAMERFKNIAEGMGKYFLAGTPIQGASNFFDAMTGKGDMTLARAGAFTASQAIPASGLLRYVNQWIDPTVRQPRDFYEALKVDLPTLSQDVAPKLDNKMQTIQRTNWDRLPPYAIGIKNEKEEAQYQQMNEVEKRKQEQKNRVEDWLKTLPPMQQEIYRKTHR